MSPLADRYYWHWQSTRFADALGRFLVAHPDLSVVHLVEVLLADQVLQWQDATGPTVEQYLQRFPAVTDRQPLVLELLCGEWRAARRLGLPIQSDTYEARFPNLAESLRRQIEVVEWLRVMADEIESESDPAE